MNFSPKLGSFQKTNGRFVISGVKFIHRKTSTTNINLSRWDGLSHKATVIMRWHVSPQNDVCVSDREHFVNFIPVIILIIDFHACPNR